MTGLPVPVNELRLQVQFCKFRVILRIVVAEDVILPPLGIAYHTFPYTLRSTFEHEIVLGRFRRFETENFYVRAGWAAEMQPRGYDLGVIEDHDRIRRQKVRDIPEYVLGDSSVLISEQFRCIPLREGILGDALVSQRIRVVRDVQLWNHLVLLI